MAEYHVGCGAFAIYAGTLNSKNKCSTDTHFEFPVFAWCMRRKADILADWKKGGDER